MKSARRVFIIAEAGVNHNGSLIIARRLVDAAKKAGANAVKFQTYVTEELVMRSARKAEYQKKRSAGRNQFGMLKRYELSRGDFRNLSAYCRKKKIIFLSTPFDPGSAAFLRTMRLPVFKVSSGELTNLPLLRLIAGYGKPVILSTGMATVGEIRDAVAVIRGAGNPKIMLLQCTSNYPAKFDDANLRAMVTLGKEFGLPVGYSDHTLGIEAAVAATAMGASVIEKHLTLDKKMAGPDHAASVEPDEFSRMVASIRNVERALGDGIKRPARSELPVRSVVRKSVVARCFIPKGTRITRDMLAAKRPAGGMEPKCMDTIVGRKARSDIRKDSMLKSDMI